jgi:hypothetical protein
MDEPRIQSSNIPDIAFRSSSGGFNLLTGNWVTPDHAVVTVYMCGQKTYARS